MNKCIGCGSLLQSIDKNKEGYVDEKNKKYCYRCFRIRNYGEYSKSLKTNEDYEKILDNINKTNDLVVLLIDVFSIQDVNKILNHLNNDILLVLSKRDVLPKSLYEEKLLNYIDNKNIKDKVLISSKKNYNLDELIYKINKYKKSKNVYVVGYTNSGKSSMINKIIKNYSDKDIEITTSILPSTTLDTINIDISDDLCLIDTPGILIDDCIYNYLDSKDLKRVLPTKEIKPIIYQVKGLQTIIIDEFAKIEVSDKCSMVLFFSNELKIDRNYKELKGENLINLDVNNQDIVFNGLGFIKVSGCASVKISITNKIGVYLRDSLI